ncbi:hypothetical protein [Priestia aryabhattai]
MKPDHFIEIYNGIYEDVLKLEENLALPTNTILQQQLINHLPGVLSGTDFYVSPTGIALPINEEQGLMDPYNYYNYSYYNEEKQRIVNCPIVEIW